MRRAYGKDGGVLNRGFELQWRSMEGCGKCEGSNGRCGHNSIMVESMCFCSDGRITTDQCKKGVWGTFHRKFLEFHWKILEIHRRLTIINLHSSPILLLLYLLLLFQRLSFRFLMM
ncbi:hypothetical protein L6452_04645 [Arctium lappa]|uniref:Uncharacterized protein n=1 Tax=Arctium lappa TaxID=4217 RepID=A0ACB9EE76_ARCLA|nr:hypothetical protein L6452_04645 [Arctium lappa]